MEIDDKVLDELKGSVATLTRAIEDMNEGKVDRATVEQIAAEVLEKRREADEIENRKRQERSGFLPEDLEDDALPALNRRGKSLNTRDKLDLLLTRSAKRGAAWSGRDEGQITRFHEASDGLVLLGAVLANAEYGNDFDVRETDYYREEYLPSVRAVSAGGAATGAEYVPTLFSASLIDRVNLQLKVAALFSMVDMPSNPFKLPALAVARVRGGLAAEQTADTGQTKVKVITPGTRNVTMTAVKFAARMLVSREAEEDSIIAILPWMQSEIVDYLSADIEDSIINGDTTGTHMDNDTTAADDPRKNWSGLRKLANSGAKTDGSAATLTVALLRGNRKAMAKYGINPSQLTHVLSVNSLIQLLSDTTVQTVDKYGAQATVITGELAKADGVAIVCSEYVRTDLDATGVNSATGGNNIKTEAITVNSRGFLLGQRRALAVEVYRELYAESDQDLLMATQRKAFTSLYPSTENTVAITYNLAK